MTDFPQFCFPTQYKARGLNLWRVDTVKLQSYDFASLYSFVLRITNAILSLPAAKKTPSWHFPARNKFIEILDFLNGIVIVHITRNPNQPDVSLLECQRESECKAK